MFLKLLTRIKVSTNKKYDKIIKLKKLIKKKHKMKKIINSLLK